MDPGLGGAGDSLGGPMMDGRQSTSPNHAFPYAGLVGWLVERWHGLAAE